MKPKAQDPTREFSLAYWDASGMTPGSYYPHDTILTATAIRELISIREKGALTPSQDKALRHAQETLQSGACIVAVSIPGESQSPVRISLQHRHSGEWSSIEVPHTPDALARIWGKDFWRKLSTDADLQRQREERYNANGPRFDVPDTPLSEPATERLLRTWFAENPEVSRIGGQSYFKTAQLGEVSLWTHPKRVMDRPGQFDEYKETDGVGYIFLDASGWAVDDFSGSRHIAGPKQASFEWFGKIKGLGAADWVADRGPDIEPDLSP